MPCVASTKAPHGAFVVCGIVARFLDCTTMVAHVTVAGNAAASRVQRFVTGRIGANIRALVVHLIALVRAPECSGCRLLVIITAERLTEMQMNYAVVLQLRPCGITLTGHCIDNTLFSVALRRAGGLAAGVKKGRFATPLKMPRVELPAADYRPSCESMSSMAPCDTPALSGPLSSPRPWLNSFTA